MFHAQSSLLDYTPLPLPHGAPSSLLPSRGSIHFDPHHAGQFGRLAEQSTITSYEPDDPVEVSNTKVTTMLLPSRRASDGSTYNSGEDIATTPASSEMDERQSMGMLA